METHGRTRDASLLATGEGQPRLVGGEKPWSRWLRRVCRSSDPGPLAQAPGKPPQRPTLVSASGRGRMSHELALALATAGLTGTSQRQMPAHLGERAEAAGVECAATLVAHHEAGCRIDHDREASSAGAILQERLERGSSSRVEGALARSRPRGELAPPEHDATGTGGAEPKTSVARHTRLERGNHPRRRGDPMPGYWVEAQAAVREGRPSEHGSDGPRAPAQVRSCPRPRSRASAREPQVTSPTAPRVPQHERAGV